MGADKHFFLQKQALGQIIYKYVNNPKWHGMQSCNLGQVSLPLG